jgi:hypothetical protein
MRADLGRFPSALPDRGKLAFRGVFTEVGEAIAIAESSDRPSYVAMGPAGGYSVFKRRELPWGDVEGDSAEAWPLDDVVVFLPPSYASEPGREALKVLRCRLCRHSTNSRSLRNTTAWVLRVSQPRISDQLRSRIDLSITDTLIDMLARPGTADLPDCRGGPRPPAGAKAGSTATGAIRLRSTTPLWTHAEIRAVFCVPLESVAWVPTRTYPNPTPTTSKLQSNGCRWASLSCC